MKSVISINNLSYSIDSTNILLNCTLQINKGDLVCLLGLNGCGKTTLLSCIFGFNKISKNTVFLYDTDIQKLSRRQIAQTISFVPQTIDNHSSLSCLEYLSLGRLPYKKLNKKLNEVDLDIIHKTVSELGISYLLHRNMDVLSGGEKQLVMIATSLIQDTDVIIMDEPTSALDYKNQSILLQLIQHLNSIGKTILFSTHNPNHALSLNARLCIMDKGTIITVDECKKCINSGILEKIYDNKIEIIKATNSVVCTYNLNNVKGN